MNKVGLLVLFAVMFMASCNLKKEQVVPADLPFKEVVADSVSEHTSDSLEMAEILEEKPRVIRGNELFEDFIFNYATDPKLQLSRTKFPLSFYESDSVIRISKDQWKHDKLFIEEPSYTLLFDNEEDMDIVGDTATNSVQVEWFVLKNALVKRYYFQRIDGEWILEAINQRKVRKSEENENFLEFYDKFAMDSLYQMQHICNPLQFVTIDPDDEFSILETTLDLNQWPTYRSFLPLEKLSNISYGQQNKDDAQTKILKVNGAGNGFCVLFYFRKRNDAWELYRFEDTSV